MKLLAIDGDLYYPPNPSREYLPNHPLILLIRYPEGDCDTIEWPNPDRENLHTCLFNDRECGTIQDEEVLLPDGTSAWR